ncbi:MAG: CHAT domain-containing protein [Acidobacteriia bacterium]|nr:CHAT domain-containing protein [Terriglobia bacterium]
MFLSEETGVAAEFTAQPRAATRGQSFTPGALDFSYDLADGEAAILAIRHPSGALTFHLPVESASRGLRQPNQVRFVITVRSTDEATGTRGIVSKAIKATLIKVGRVVADKLVSFALPKLAAAFEKNAWNKARLQEGWHIVTKETLGAKALAPGKPVSTERSLLFLHGTFSNAASAYGALADSNFFDRVKALYDGRIFAFNHFTVSRTPEENTRMLLEGLPDQTTVFDVITHSRGGLVLRNLVERAHVFGPMAQRFKLGRAVLVASPNDGTPLATPQRWHDTVGWLANLLELFPENPFTTGAAFVANGLVWMARHASGDLPGLHSMDGAGNPIAQLQSPPGPPEDAYSALVANYNPTEKVLLRMLDTGIDQFFGSANDLVVPTAGGWHVGQPGKVLIPAARIGCFGAGGNLQADSVTHIDFFSRPETVDFLTRALAGEQQPLKRVDPLAALPDRRLLREGAAVYAATAGLASGKESKVVRSKAIRSPAVSPKLPALRVTVVNGDLTFEKDPVLLGHYRATRLTGTEEVMDKLIDGAMKRSLGLGFYPLAPGTNQIFLNTTPNPEDVRRMPRPKAVIVAGLGEEGRLNAANLALTVRQAVIAWAQRTAELQKRVPQSFDLTATLLASGGTGITAGQAAQRITLGVYEANALLSGESTADDRQGQNRQRSEGANASDGKEWPRVGQLRIIELYLDRATEAWRALKMQEAASPERYKVADEIEAGTGPLPRPLDLGYRGADYDFIAAETVQDKNHKVSVRYTLDTKRARNEVFEQKTQRRLLRDLVATASDAGNHDPQIGRTLFRLLVPVGMEAFLAGSGELQIELDPETAGIPWELLDTDEGDDQNPEGKWAIRTKLLRKLRTTDFREQVRDATAKESILVIGEPSCPPQYPRLDGAWAEAEAVYKSLAGSIGLEQVERLFSDDPDKTGPVARAVINALLSRDWRIVHIAGHGALRAPDGGPGGVVLSNGAFLGPNEIGGMRIVPELVFVNCCHLAARSGDQLLATDSALGYDRARFASGVAEELINIGVRCVIAAGWAVNDLAARSFATTFYESLLRENRFIDAVAEARTAAYRNDDNTWAAYQCYGDPDWFFRRKDGDVRPTTTAAVDEFASVASETALKLTLETILVQTKFQRYKPQTQLEKLRSLEVRFAPSWGGSGSVAELFGAAYAEARDLKSAIRWYDLALKANDAKGSIKAAEQLANVRARLAWETVEKAQKQRDKMKVELEESGAGNRAADRKARAVAKRSLAAAERALRTSLSSGRKSIKEATTLLEKLVAVHRTIETESIYGSAWKRLALIEAASGRPAEEQKAIEAMKLHYQGAAEIGRKNEASDVFYPALNYLAAELSLNAGRRGWKGFDPSIFQSTRASLEAKSLRDPDFWSVVGQTELKLYNAVAGRKLASERESLERGYQDLYRRVSAPWMWSSVYDTAQFVLRKYSARASDRESKAADALLTCLMTFAQAK